MSGGLGIEVVMVCPSSMLCPVGPWAKAALLLVVSLLAGLFMILTRPGLDKQKGVDALMDVKPLMAWFRVGT